MATNYKCHFCKTCRGEGCIGQLPGMGGVRGNENFKLNVLGWEKVRSKNKELVSEFLRKPAEDRIPHICLAPITGAVENIGFETEDSYYSKIVEASHQVGIGLCIGDGYPDEKLKYGIEAIKNLNKNVEAGVFIKPYPNPRIFERIEWSKSCATVVGVDIDSYNLVTMRNLVKLEKKTAAQLIEIKNHIKVPFAVKGVFTEDDIELIKEVRPAVAYISNHGGRIDTRSGSTADFLESHVEELRKYCDEVWVDGGIRTPLDVATALALGADKVLIGRPFVTALCKGGVKGLCEKVLELSLLQYAM